MTTMHIRSAGKTSTVELTSRFIQIMHGVFGEKGRVFLAQLPALLEECAERWELELLPPFELSLNYVAPARRPDGTEVVLKLGVPHPEFTTEVAALKYYEGSGAAKLYEADASRGIILMERVRPGSMLGLLDDDEESMRLAVDVMKALWRPLPTEHAFPTLHRWMGALLDDERRRVTAQVLGYGPIDEAAAVARELIASQAAPVLLHGDLHQWNILSSERVPWLAIDPKGVAGEAAYEPAALMRNPMPKVLTWPDLDRVTERRLDQLSEMLGFDRWRLAAWNWVQGVLSVCWDIEGNDPNIRQFMPLVEAGEAAYRRAT